MSESYFKDNEVTLIISATESTTLHKTGTTYFTFDRNVGKQIVNLKIRGADGVKDVDLNDVEAIKMYYQFTDASAKYLSEEYTVINANAGKFYFMLNNDRVDYVGEVLIYIYVVMKERTASGEVKSFEAGAIGTTYRESLIDTDLPELEALGWDRLDKLEAELRKHVDSIKAEMDRDLKTVKQDLTTAQSDINKIQSQIDDNDIVRQEEFNNLASTGRNVLRNGRTPALHNNENAVHMSRTEIITENNITFVRCTLAGGTAATRISMFTAFPRTQIIEDLAGKTVELTHKIRANKEHRVGPLMVTLYGGVGGVTLPGHDTRPIGNLSTYWQPFRYVITIPETYNQHTGLRFNLRGADGVEIGDWVDFRDWSISIIDDKWSLPIEDLIPTTAPMPLANTPQIGSSGRFADAAHVHQLPTASQVGALPISGGTLTGGVTTSGAFTSTNSGVGIRLRDGNNNGFRLDLTSNGARARIRLEGDGTESFAIAGNNGNIRAEFLPTRLWLGTNLDITGTISAPRLNGNADTATRLQNRRQINGINFDGTADIMVTANPTNTPLALGTDLNDITESGEYRCSVIANAQTMLNLPVVTAFFLKVERTNANSVGTIQTFKTYLAGNAHRQFVRSIQGVAGWGEWFEIPLAVGTRRTFDMTVTRATSLVTKSGKEVDVSDELTTCQNELQECKAEIAELKTMMLQIREKSE